MTTSARFAVYLVPPRESLLWDRGCRWLGRDPEGGALPLRPPVPDWPEDRLIEITRSPRHYGFHATLKAPFRLAPGAGEQALHERVCRIADAMRGFSLPALEVGRLGNFLALRPAGGDEPLRALERECVMQLDDLRAPLEDPERTRRRAMSLTLRQATFLERWGYPYVLDEYRFHMTLTGRLDDQDANRLAPWLREWFAPALEHTGPADIGVFVQAQAGADFLLRNRVALRP